MSQQIINISTPDDGLGDVLRNGFDKANQNFTELYNGKVDKVTGKGLSENDFTDADKAKLNGIEAGAEVNVQADWGETDPLSDSFILNKPPSLYSAFGYFHYSDLDTQTTPLNFVSSTPLQLINDTLGAFTNENQAPYGISSVWDKPTDSLDFSQLSVGDGVLFRADLLISTTTINQKLQLYIKFGIGTPSEYDLLIDSWYESSVITFKGFIKDVSFSIDNEDWRTAPAKIYILSNENGSVKVNGWYIPIIRKSLNIIDFNSDPLKLDKVSTAGVERAYIINADGSQGTKATIEFKDVLEFANLAYFPVIGETGKIYVALDTNFTYRWGGSIYVQFGGSVTPMVYSFEMAQPSLPTTTNWQVSNYNSSKSDDAFRNNTATTYPTLNQDVGARRVYKSGTVSKIVFKTLRRNPGIAIDFDIYVAKFEKPDGAIHYTNETILSVHNISSLNALINESVIRELTLSSTEVNEGDLIYVAYRNNTGVATTLYNPEVIVEL